VSDPERRSVLRHRDYALLFAGQAVSLVGDGVLTVALALETLRIDPRPEALSFVLAARLVPMLVLLLVGGVVVDRVPRRLAMLASDAGRGVVVGATTVLIATGHASVGALVAMALLFGVFDAFFYPASTAIVPEIVPAPQLVEASAWRSTSQTLAGMLIGPALGGLLVGAVGPAWSFGADAASFAVSAACLLAMRAAPRPRPRGARVLDDVAEGLRYCWRTPWLGWGIAVAGVVNFATFSPLGVLVPLLIHNVLHHGGVALGLTLAAGGAGGGLVSLLVARYGAPRRAVLAMWLAWGASGVAVALFSLAGSVVAVAFLEGMGGACLIFGNVLWSPLVQREVPTELQGRVSSVDWLVSLGLAPLGVLVAGLAAGAVGVRTTLLVGGAVGALAPLALLVPGMLDLDHAAVSGGES
jgi:MFS transporter, DHA3 family, tetracycline resistance protein